MRPAHEVTDIFRGAGPAYRAARAGHLSLDQRKVMLAIEICRTAVMGGHVNAVPRRGRAHLKVGQIAGPLFGFSLKIIVSIKARILWMCHRTSTR
jgi:hypothetical protein